MKPTIDKPKIKFEPRDIWVGVYWKYGKWAREPQSDLWVYVCLVPMLPIIFHIHFIDIDWYRSEL